MRSSRLLDALVILSLLGAVAVGIFMSLGKSVQARVGAATQKMVGSIGPTQAVDWTNSQQFPGFHILAFEPGYSPIAIDGSRSQYFTTPGQAKFFLLDESKLKKNEHYLTLRDNDPRLIPVAVDPGVSGNDWAALTLEKRPDGSYILSGQSYHKPQGLAHAASKPSVEQGGEAP